MSEAQDVLNQQAQGQLRSIIERAERLESEKAEIAEQVKEVLKEGKLSGFDPKIIRKVLRLRKISREARQEEEALIDLYMVASGTEV
ncbi:GapR family DNA-binding domain-containing protein [Phenylobacterium sp.]|uniref:DUF2312 domain-containing protein n=1 Tax=Phenylobacterium sp. TaxID=1871053 RepID=UPI002724695F|nr:GapR family DNA-binding domain-containing protein [Phenylobacterium sp.]MDO8800075.1 DUF2312 domain-containing protein [Phenylobacterium sp.]